MCVANKYWRAPPPGGARRADLVDTHPALVDGLLEAAVVTARRAVRPVLQGSSPQEKNLRSSVYFRDGSKIVFAYDVGVATSIGFVNPDGIGFKSIAGGSGASYASP